MEERVEVSAVSMIHERTEVGGGTVVSANYKEEMLAGEVSRSGVRVNAAWLVNIKASHSGAAFAFLKYCAKKQPLHENTHNTGAHTHTHKHAHTHAHTWRSERGTGTSQPALPQYMCGAVTFAA